MARRNYLSQIIKLIDLRFAIDWTDPKANQRDDTSRHRFKNPFTMSKTQAADPPTTGRSRIAFHFILEILLSGGAYRDRTDDPLLAKQVLSQLS
jgi:hypothetical protein